MTEPVGIQNHLVFLRRSSPWGPQGSRQDSIFLDPLILAVMVSYLDFFELKFSIATVAPAGEAR